LIHIIITDYNLGLYRKDNSTRKVLINSIETKINADQWMEKRLDVFRKFTVPSIENQSNNNFIWFIRIDPQTPKSDITKINNSLSSDNMIIVLTDYRDVSRVIPKTVQWALITNFDNDDILSLDFVEKVQSIFRNFSSHGEYLIDVNLFLYLSGDLTTFYMHNVALRRRIQPGFCSSHATIVRPINMKQRREPFIIRHTVLANSISNILCCDAVGARIIHDTNVCTRMPPKTSWKHGPITNIQGESLEWLGQTFGIDKNS